jgi:hypothetical protein
VKRTVVSTVYSVQPPLGMIWPLQNCHGPFAFHGHFSPYGAGVNLMNWDQFNESALTGIYRQNLIRVRNEGKRGR